jgi:hypothetical protein
VDYGGIVFILHVGMPWSMIDYGQESGRRGRSGEVSDSVIMIEEGEVEDRVSRSRGDVDIVAMGQFLETGGRGRGVMSEYLDGKRMECGDDIEWVGCDRCGEGLVEWQESKARWAKEWEQVVGILDGLVDGCGVCWVMGKWVGVVGTDWVMGKWIGVVGTDWVMGEWVGAVGTDWVMGEWVGAVGTDWVMGE